MQKQISVLVRALITVDTRWYPEGLTTAYQMVSHDLDSDAGSFLSVVDEFEIQEAHFVSAPATTEPQS